MELRFADFNNKYSGQECYVVGRGPTRYDYSELATVQQPVFFINDAVALEHFVRGDSFFFAHDRAQAGWLKKGIKSVAVLPEDGKVISGRNDPCVTGNVRLCFYRWKNVSPREQRLKFTRDELANNRELYTNSGTIHSLVHFVWYCGIKRIRFVGCDGMNDRTLLRGLGDRRTGYDRRLPNASGTSPWWDYHNIRSVQERLCRALGLEWEYLGALSSFHPSSEMRIPAAAHFSGRSTETYVSQFRELHPAWKVHLWTELPAEFTQYCERAGIPCHHSPWLPRLFSLWLMKHHGGICLRADVLPLRAFDALRRFDHFFAWRRLHTEVGDAVMGSCPQGGVIDALLESMLAKIRSGLTEVSFSALLGDLPESLHGELTVLPEHYFNMLRTTEGTRSFLKLNKSQREAQILKLAGRITDGVQPFAIDGMGQYAS